MHLEHKRQEYEVSAQTYTVLWHNHPDNNWYVLNCRVIYGHRKVAAAVPDHLR